MNFLREGSAGSPNANNREYIHLVIIKFVPRHNSSLCRRSTTVFYKVLPYTPKRNPSFLGLHRTEIEKKNSTCLKSRLRITDSLPSHPLAFHVQSISHYKTIIPIAIPIIPISPDCEQEATDALDVAAVDAPDLVALVAVAGATVPVVPPGRTMSTPRFLQTATVTLFVSEEEVRV